MPSFDKSLRRRAMGLAGALLGGIVLAPGGALAQNAAKTITIALVEEPGNLEMCNSTSSDVARVIHGNVGESLTDIDTSDGRIKPRLAESWTQVNDLTWRFKLRQGVKYTDGSAFNAEAAAFGINRLMNPKMTCVTRAQYFSEMKLTAKAVDDSTLELVTEQPVPILPAYMSWMLLPSPKTPAEASAQIPVGTGPYKFGTYKAGQEIVLEKNDAWWGPKLPIDTVRYLWRKESSVRAAMIAIGEADLTPEIAEQDATDPKLDFTYQNAETAFVRFDMKYPPLDDRRVRLAMNHAINLDAMRGTVFSKSSTPATNVVIAGISGHNPNLKPYAYDPAKAKQLLAEAKAAGAPVDKEIRFFGRTNFWPNNSEPLEAMQQMWTAVGLATKIEMMDATNWRKFYFKPFSDNVGPNVIQIRHNNQGGDAVFSMHGRFGCTGTASTLCNPALDKLMDTATRTPAGPDRVKAWQEAARIVHEDDVASIMLFHLQAFARVGARINYKPNLLTTSVIEVQTITFK